MQFWKTYRAAVAAFLCMVSMALTSSCLSFFVQPVCQTLGVGRGSFALYYSLMTVTGAVANPFLGQFAGRKGSRKLILISAVWASTGFFLFSFATKLWMFYAVALLMGAFSTTCVMFCANVIVQQNYSGAQASSLLGLVMAGSGAGGMVFSLIVPKIIDLFGWQMGYRFLGACWLVIMLIAAFCLGTERKVELPSGVSGAVGLGMTRKEALKSPKLYLMMVTICILAGCCGIQQQVPAVLSGMGYSAGQASAMFSLMTAALAVGKVLQGMVYGKMGIRKGGTVMIVVFAASFVMLMFRTLAYPGLVALAFGMGIYTTLLPMVARTVFGTRKYASIWSMIAVAGSAGTIIANPTWGMVYDMTGSYNLAMVIAAVLLTGALAALHLVLKEKK